MEGNGSGQHHETTLFIGGGQKVGIAFYMRMLRLIPHKTLSTDW